MMYVGYPSLSEPERLASLPVLKAQSVRVAPSVVLKQLEGSTGISDFRLSSVLGRPAYLLRTDDGARHGYFADTGEVFRQVVNSADALRAARLHADNRGIKTGTDITLLTQLDMDQWSISSALHRHRPLYLVALNDADDTELYISSRTGEVVRDTTANERAWNWLGANLHWLYPMQLRRHPTIWHWVIVVLSLAGIVSIITGTVIGVMRLRLRNPYRGKDVTPFKGVMKLHHVLGLLFFLPVTTYMFSGLMSMNPWGIFNDTVPYNIPHAAYRGNPTVAMASAKMPAFTALREALDALDDSREIVWQWLASEPYQYAISGQNHRSLLTGPAGEDGRANHANRQHPGVVQLRAIMAGYSITGIEILDTYDNYYYSHRQSWRPLPVLRVRFNDPAQTWFHLDGSTGEMLNRLTATGRIQRWLYNGLHSLDFSVLIYNRPLWDIVVILLSSIGLVFSVTSLVVGWRRLR